MVSLEKTNRKACLVVLALSPVVGIGCQRDGNGVAPASAAAVAPVAADTAKVDAPGMHNVYRLTDQLYSGSYPEGEEGFRTLQKLGVKTILSVDGDRPEVALAKKYGMPYVHIPVGYAGISGAQSLSI